MASMAFQSIAGAIVTLVECRGFAARLSRGWRVRLQSLCGVSLLALARRVRVELAERRETLLAGRAFII
jgi:lysylphosphatidylglycerol synthetase-like protein (DUF2156 family)